MYSSVHPRLRHFWNQGQGRGLEWAQHCLQLISCEQTNVSAGFKLTIDSAIIYIRERSGRMVIGGSICAHDVGDPHVKPIFEALCEEGVSAIQPKTCQKLRPGFPDIGGEGLTSSLLDGTSELHDRSSCSPHICVDLHGWWTRSLLVAASQNRVPGRLR